jgi:hypothetical protein
LTERGAANLRPVPQPLRTSVRIAALLALLLAAACRNGEQVSAPDRPACKIAASSEDFPALSLQGYSIATGCRLYLSGEEVGTLGPVDISYDRAAFERLPSDGRIFEKHEDLGGMWLYFQVAPSPATPLPSGVPTGVAGTLLRSDGSGFSMLVHGKDVTEGKERVRGFARLVLADESGK